jgi:FkbM family methyltransferase
MNRLTEIIHRFIIRSKKEEFFVDLRRKVNFIRKLIPVGVRHKFASVGRLIPQSSEYPKDDRYSLTRDNTNFIINRSDYVQWRLFYGVRDNALKEAKKHLRSNSIVLDIGSNFGAFSLKLATHIAGNKFHNVKIHAFEPNPQVFDNYLANLALNPNLNDIIDLHATGLGNETGERSFQFPEDNTGAGRIADKKNGQFSVKLQRLDDFIYNLNPANIAFIKLIAEGFEPEIFKGGWNTINKYKPPVFFEVTREWWKENHSTVDEILDALKNLGYSFMIEHHNEMVPFEPDKHASRSQFNLMATIETGNDD